MFPGSKFDAGTSFRFPRVSGDVSAAPLTFSASFSFSPRERGCFSVSVP